jgi:hypothetical protein
VSGKGARLSERVKGRVQLQITLDKLTLYHSPFAKVTDVPFFTPSRFISLLEAAAIQREDAKHRDQSIRGPRTTSQIIFYTNSTPPTIRIRAYSRKLNIARTHLIVANCSAKVAHTNFG